MGRTYQILLPLLGLFLTRVDLTDLFPLVYKVEVLNIYDGDTVLVGHGSYKMKIRLAKIDAPEKDQPSLSGEVKAGVVSRACFIKLLKAHKEFFLEIEKYDIYGRILGDINQLSLALVKNGCASLYPHAEFFSRHEKQTYLMALDKAKTSRLGVWKYGGFKQPKLWRKTNRRSGVRQLRQSNYSQRPYRPGQKYG